MAKTDRSDFGSLFPGMRGGLFDCQNRSDRECHGKGMSAARQISRRFGRTTGARTRSAVSDCVVRTVLFGSDPLKTSENQENDAWWSGNGGNDKICGRVMNVSVEGSK